MFSSGDAAVPPAPTKYNIRSCQSSMISIQPWVLIGNSD